MLNMSITQQLIICSMCTALRFLRQRLRPQCQPPPFVRSTWRLQLYSTTNPRKEEQDSIVDTREGQRQSIPECSTQASYPRLLHSENDISCSDFATTYKNLMKGEIEDEARHTIHGITDCFKLKQFAHTCRKDRRRPFLEQGAFFH